MNKQLIFDYLGKPYDESKDCGDSKHFFECVPTNIDCDDCPFYLHKLDMKEAVDIMEKKGDWEKFNDYSVEYWHNHAQLGTIKFHNYVSYLLQNFFELLSDWLEVRK